MDARELSDFIHDPTPLESGEQPGKRISVDESYGHNYDIDHTLVRLCG